jgi:hypothetical protein
MKGLSVPPLSRASSPLLHHFFFFPALKRGVGWRPSRALLTMRPATHLTTRLATTGLRWRTTGAKVREKEKKMVGAWGCLSSPRPPTLTL